MYRISTNTILITQAQTLEHGPEEVVVLLRSTCKGVEGSKDLRPGEVPRHASHLDTPM